MMIPAIATSARAIPSFITALPQTLDAVAKVAIPIFINCFRVGQIPYFIGFGAKEILYDATNRPFDYETVHGMFMVGCGCCELVAAIHYFGLITIATSALAIVGHVSIGCFALANFLMVCEQIRILAAIAQIPDDASQQTKDAAESTKIGALISLFSGLSYLVAIALVLCGGPTAIVVLLMLLGLCCGGSKILYDILTSSDVNIKF